MRTASPALGVYQRDPAGDVFRAWSIWVLGIDGDAIAEITDMAKAAVFAASDNARMMTGTVLNSSAGAVLD